jgi:hypothetical protein
MLGPFSVAQVDAAIIYTSPGAYILSRDGRHAFYVGRSDVDVGSRIKQSAQEQGCPFFWFEYTTSPRDAYRLECELWHKYGGPPLGNENHPPVPAGTYWRCPIQGCSWS